MALGTRPSLGIASSVGPRITIEEPQTSKPLTLAGERRGGESTSNTTGTTKPTTTPPMTRVVQVKLKSDFGGGTNIFRGLYQRETGLSSTRKNDLRKRPFLEDFSSTAKGSGTLVNLVNEEQCPPFAIQFGKSRETSHYLAVADEDGYVTLTDTTQELPTSRHEDHQPVARWGAHNNSIFDLAWSHNDERITTVSGDETVRIWSSERQAHLNTLVGHTGSIKSVSYKEENQNILASAGRDGMIMLWDLRSHRQSGSQPHQQQQGHPQPVKVIHNAHAGNKKPRQQRRKKSKRAAPDRQKLHSVTTVLFLKVDNILASSGSDGLVKFWDTRKLNKPTHLITLPQPPELSRMYGIPSMAQNESGSKLAVTSYNDSIYLYDCVRPEQGPSHTYKGHQISSFYVKIAFSPDGSHLLSGSSDSNAYIWQVDRPEDGAYVIKGHEGEVSGVSWCPTDFNKIATCGDDSTFRVWNIDRKEKLHSRKIAMPPTVSLHYSKTLRGKHNYVNQLVETCPKHQRIGNYVQETYIDCSKLVEGRKTRHAHPVQYRNTTLDEVWGVNKNNSK